MILVLIDISWFLYLSGRVPFSQCFISVINIKENLDDNILVVPVFVDPNVQEVHRFIDIFPKSVLQFHGNESLKFCKQFDRPFIKSINQKEFTNIVDTTKEYISADYFLLDSGTEDLHGGTGEIFDWKKIPNRKS